ncbi:protein D1-like [Ornithodoros turicata]|uniref:protein D1-like n=1 Tax=Ornithodoros turicata TaxID=34597 RepID=UPI003139A972
MFYGVEIFYWSAVLAIVEGQGDDASALKAHGVIPDVISDAPAQTLAVKYSSTAVIMGSKLDLETTSTTPTIELQATDGMFTLVMVDPDAPSRNAPKMKHWRHWLVVNVPANGDIGAGDTITEYNGPSPPAGSGPHRYVFLLYAQSSPVDVDAFKISSNRGQFNLDTITKLQGVSQLKAVNFFIAERSGAQALTGTVGKFHFLPILASLLLCISSSGEA